MPADPTRSELTPLGWAGLLLPAPRQSRLLRVEGHARKGLLVLGDDLGPRLVIAWAAVVRRRFDPQRQLAQQLLGGLPRDRRRNAQLTHVDSEHLRPLLLYRDDEADRDRWIGYAPATRRAIEMVYHRRDTTTDALYRRLLPTLRDQPIDQPIRWAFFGHRLTTPAGYELLDSMLNLGNMELRLRRPVRWGEHRLSVRLLYPARLALQRQPLEQWLTRLMRVRRSMYLPRYTSWFSRQQVRHRQADTPLGPALVSEARMPIVLKLIRITTPRRQRSWLVHDQGHDRLIFVQSQTGVAAFDAIINEVTTGMHWTDDNDPTDPRETPRG